MRAAFLRTARAAALAAALAWPAMAPAPTQAAPGPGADQGLSGTSASIYRTNNSVYALAMGNGVVYAGGAFTALSSPTGAGSVTRNRLAALSTSTGAPTSFSPTLNGDVQALSVSPDGSTLYVAGKFTTVNGATRRHFAAFNTSTGALTAWNPNATGGNGLAVLASASAVYIGGSFGRVGGTAHAKLAAVGPTSGQLLTGFTATADAVVYSIALSADRSRLLVGGNFDTLAGVAQHGLGAVDPATGAFQAWSDPDLIPHTATCTAATKSILVAGDTAYVAGLGAQPGCFDGNAAVDVATGSTRWVNPCEGATQTHALIGGVLYKGSHMHDCAYNAGGSGGGFTGGFTRTRATYRLVAQDPLDGTFEHWSPSTNGGGTGGLGPLAMATDGTQLFVGGDFTRVNGASQRGLARFTPLSSTPSAAPATPTAAPTAVASGPGRVTVTLHGVADPDNGTLTYSLYRGATLVGTESAESWPWAQPVVRITDTSASAGAAYTYRYRVSDGTSTTAYSPTSAPVTAIGSTPDYRSTALGSSPSFAWSLGVDGTIPDATGNGNGGQAVGSVSSDPSGMIPGEEAIALDGTTGYLTSATAQTPTTSFSESAWFKTTTLHGGTIVAFTTDQTGSTSSGTVDRAIWMDNDGQVVFGMKAPPRLPGSPPMGPRNAVIRSPGTYNDGEWHLAVATYSGTAMSFYVDGELVGTNTVVQTLPGEGYWRAGYVNLRTFNSVFGFNSTPETSPNSFSLEGSLDEVAMYPTELSAATVGSLWAAGAAGAP